jgi:hypothetical protein
MRLCGTSTGDGVIRISPVQNYRKEIMSKIAVDWDSKTDNNNGFVYGIEHQDENGNVIDIEWFKSEKERDREVENEKI